MSESHADWLRPIDGGVILQLHIQPGAKKTEVAGIHGDALKLRLSAPPVEGRANAALLGFLAERLGLRTSNVRLLSGETGRRKRVAIDGCSEEQIRDLFEGRQLG